MSEPERKTVIRRAAPHLAEWIEKRGSGVFIRLDHEDQWQLYGIFGVPSVHNAETGRRWEIQLGRYVPVSHTAGYRWTVRSGKYVPQ